MTATIYTADSVQSLSEFENGALRIAEALARRGVTTGQRVMLKAGNSAAFLGTLFGLMHAGASIVLVDQQERAEETRNILHRTGAKLIFVDDDAQIDRDLGAISLYELLVDATRYPQVQDRHLSLDAWCDLPDSLIMWTSGSTGSPKGAVKSGRKFLKNLQRNADQVGHRPDDVLVPLLPFSHQYGLSMVMIAWLVRCSLVVAPYRRLDKALRMIGETGGTVIDATPASYRSMIGMVGRMPWLRGHLEPVRMFCAGAAPLDQPLIDRYVAEFGLPLLDSYGSTELGNIAFATPENPVWCGRAMEGIGLRIVEDGQEVPAGRAGEIEVDSPDALEGHLDEHGVFVPAPTGPQLTGDLGQLDEDGNLCVLGRKSAVQRMGYTLYPELIQRKATAAGCTSVVVSVPDERRGASLVFFVQDEAEREESYWWEKLREALPDFEQPNRVQVVKSFPLNRNGKPDKRRMEAQANEGPAHT